MTTTVSCRSSMPTGKSESWTRAVPCTECRHYAVRLTGSTSPKFSLTICAGWDKRSRLRKGGKTLCFPSSPLPVVIKCLHERVPRSNSTPSTYPLAHNAQTRALPSLDWTHATVGILVLNRLLVSAHRHGQASQELSACTSYSSVWDTSRYRNRTSE